MNDIRDRLLWRADSVGDGFHSDMIYRDALRYIDMLQIEIERLQAALNADAQTLRLHLGEMTPQEMAWKDEKKTGYEHMTQETVQAIRDTCSTPASRVGKTQSEVFKEEDTP